MRSEGGGGGGEGGGRRRDGQRVRVKGREKGGVVTCIYLKTMVYYYGWALCCLYGLACFFLPSSCIPQCFILTRLSNPDITVTGHTTYILGKDPM